MDDEKPPSERLRLRGMGRIAIDPEEPHHILLSFLDETGEEHWIGFPRESAGMVAVTVIEAAKTAADRAGSDLPTLSAAEQKLISEGMKATGVTVGVSMDGQCAVLTVRTAAGLIFEFPIPHENIQPLRIGFRKAEEILNRAKRPGRAH